MAVGVEGGIRTPARKQRVHPMEYDADPSERLVDAALRGDLAVAVDCLADDTVDVNYAGAVLIEIRSAEIVLHDESATEVRFDYCEFRTDASPLFLAAHAGDLPLVRKLLSAGADVNQKLFRGYATTAAAREGRAAVVELLLKAGAGQPACEETLVEACRHGQVRTVELILESELVRPRAAAHALVAAASRGFVDVVAALVRSGVDVNAMDRVLLQSLKPSLHANVDCTALVAAIVNRHVPVVHRLLQAGARTDIPVRLGGWSWDPVTGEEFRVGAGLAEPYTAPWCAVEYFEYSGEILRLLLQHSSLNSLHHLGRSLHHHAILCSSGAALDVLLFYGIDPNWENNAGEAPLTLSALRNQHDFIEDHALSGADFALVGQPKESQVDAFQAVEHENRAGESEKNADETPSTLSTVHNQQDFNKDLALSGTDFRLVNPAKEGQVDAFPAVELENCACQIEKNAGETPLMSLAFKNLHDFIEDLALSGADFGLIGPPKESQVDAFLAVEQENRAGESEKNADESLSTLSVVHNQQVFNKDLALSGTDFSLLNPAKKGQVDAFPVVELENCAGETEKNAGEAPLMSSAFENLDDFIEDLYSSGTNFGVFGTPNEGRVHAFPTEELESRVGEREKNAVEIPLMLCALQNFDEKARALVLGGGKMRKHRKQGRGAPHTKMVRMDEEMGVLRWGKTNGRSVVCRRAELGGSLEFRRRRRKKGDGMEKGLFRVVTATGKTVHFVCDGGDQVAELWVRGIKLVTKDVFGGRAGIPGPVRKKLCACIHS